MFKQNAKRLLNKSQEEIFTFIHETNMWGARASSSGLGSEFDATVAIRREIPRLLTDLHVDTILDVPCGDFGWLSAIDLPVKTYIGGDIVRSIVSELQAKHGGSQGNTHYTFRHLDITKDSLPDADIILCRDCLVHFSFSFIAKTIQNLKRSRIRYLLTTTFTKLSNNIDIQNGDWRPLNLEKAPVSFSSPQVVINEECTEANGAYADKSLGLWEIASLPSTPV